MWVKAMLGFPLVGHPVAIGVLVGLASVVGIPADLGNGGDNATGGLARRDSGFSRRCRAGRSCGVIGPGLK